MRNIVKEEKEKKKKTQPQPELVFPSSMAMRTGQREHGGDTAL